MWGPEEPKKTEGQGLVSSDPYYQNAYTQGQPQHGYAHGQQAPPARQKTYAESIFERYLGFLHPAYWKQYFDFDQDIIGQRILSSIHPFQGNLGTLVKDKPDFYGPIWYLITLVFTLSVLSNFSHYLAYIFGTSSRDVASQRAIASFKFSYLLKALAVCFGSWLLAPLTFILGLLLMGKVPSGVQIAELFCIWGYSYIFYIFAAIISTFPVSVISAYQTIIFFAFLTAACLASFMLISQLGAYLSQFTGTVKYVLLALVIGWQALIFFAFRFAFF